MGNWFDTPSPPKKTTAAHKSIDFDESYDHMDVSENSGTPKTPQNDNF